MTTALRTSETQSSATRRAPATDAVRENESARVLSPRLTELLDWLNREWDAKTEQAACGSFAISG